ncbi:tyrosine phosphatase family protein [Brevundimonas sp.]|jgi:predicted protein tyrosine phosphatase|uniref:tyrosine phosphatase family protein n=1 Tax=Brevundimonas sp. TaxID=1871086 RepID=UPI0037C0E989
MILIVSPLHEVETVIRARRPSHIVSLASPGAAEPDLPSSLERLALNFHDIVEPADGLQPVTEEQVERLLAFAAAWPRTAPLLVHCWAGVSRSPAAAYAIACMIRGEGETEALAWRLRRAAPFATPNRRLVALADQILGRQGAMVAAIAAIARGADTFTGATFDL